MAIARALRTSKTRTRAWTRLSAQAPLLVVTLGFVLFRLPALMNAGYINSDGAVTALQARHMLRGEFAWLRWGRDYLTSTDSLITAPFFAIFGATPLVVMSVTLLGQLTSTWFAFAVLRRRIQPWTAVIAVLPTVFMTMALNIYLFYDVRQWCLAVVACSFWLLDGASSSERPRLRYAVGIFTGICATFVDLFAVQFMPGLALFAILCCFDGRRDWRRWLQRGSVVVAGGIGGFLFVRMLEQAVGMSTNRATWLMSRIPSNLALLRDTCLPWVIGSKVFTIGSNPYPDPWTPPPAYAALQTAGTVVFACVLVFGALSFFIRRIPWEVRRLGVLGSAVATSSLAGFLVTITATDMWGARILAPVILTMPFTVAPIGYLLRNWRLGVALSPYLLSIALGGWIGYGVFVDGVLPTRTPRGISAEEAQVATMLRNRGVGAATAHFWLAYRLAFIFHENPIVYPLDSEDLYPPYRRLYDAANLVAYIFHPSQPWIQPQPYEASLRAAHADFEKINMFDFTIYLVNRHR
jgi:hypothetical protein